MARPAPYTCTSCGADALRWSGQCPTCQEWNTLTEKELETVGASTSVDVSVVELAGIVVEASQIQTTGVAEVDRVLGGGLTPGSVTLVAGDPGIGKSTLCLQAAMFVASKGGTALVVAAEEAASQVAARARRLGDASHGIELVATADLVKAVAALEKTDASLCVIDSVSTISDSSVRGPGGGVTQVRNAAEQLSGVARRRGIALLLVGHVTKDGDLAGPRALEHLVDTVMMIEGDRHHPRRIATTVKHRFGPAGEVGVLELDGTGLSSVADPSAALLAERGPSLPGSVASVLAEGNRPLVVEIQALVTPAMAAPARVAQGVSPTRLRQLAAVIDAHCDLGIGRMDLFVACAGAMKALEPAIDVAVVGAIVSAFFGKPLPEDVVAFGEIGLTGAVRPVLATPRRLAEAERVGLRRALVPSGTPTPNSLEVMEVATVAELVARVSQLSATTS